MMENAEAPATNAHRRETERFDLFIFKYFTDLEAFSVILFLPKMFYQTHPFVSTNFCGNLLR